MSPSRFTVAKGIPTRLGHRSLRRPLLGCNVERLHNREHHVCGGPPAKHVDLAVVRGGRVADAPSRHRDAGGKLAGGCVEDVYQDRILGVCTGRLCQPADQVDLASDHCGSPRAPDVPAVAVAMDGEHLPLGIVDCRLVHRGTGQIKDVKPVLGSTNAVDGAVKDRVRDAADPDTVELGGAFDGRERAPRRSAFECDDVTRGARVSRT